MIETYARPIYQRWLVETVIHRWRVRPDTVSFAALISGVAILPALLWGYPGVALVLLALSGWCDTVDGTLARRMKLAHPRGAVLDIMVDRTVEFVVVFALFLVAPEARGLPSLLMLGAILLCVTSFLVVGIFSDNRSEKSFHYSPGLIERPEAFLFFAAMILFPHYFVPLALLFTAGVLYTTVMRIWQFAKLGVAP
ncbi:MAG: CDP-alcohol phosphatidyltransferase family protein [Chlamydiia bacterium]|nr:CDP-alcohol phosphatidyltransferase family protein [Chlamydiia bacterium]